MMLQLQVTPSRNEQGLIQDFICRMQDVTAQAREGLTSDLSAFWWQSRRQEAIGKLATGVSRDFSKLMSGILHHTELLRLDQRIPSDSRRSIDVIDAAATHARLLSQQIRDFASADLDTATFAPLNRVIADVVTLLRRSSNRQVQIELEQDANDPVVSANSSQLTQLFLNLGLDTRETLQQGDRLLFRIRSVYIDETACRQQRLPAPGHYSQVSLSLLPLKPRDASAGPALTAGGSPDSAMTSGIDLASYIVRNLGGLIKSDTTQTGHTTIDVYLPVSPDPSPPQSLPGTQDAVPCGSRGTVLVVDDEDVILTLTSIMLAKLGYTVVTASNGLDAIDILREDSDHITLVILDLMMLGANGNNCLQLLRSSHPTLPVIIATCHNREQARELLGDAGFDAFLGKPFRQQDLAEAIDTALATDRQLTD